MHDLSPLWLGMCISMKSGGVKLVIIHLICYPFLGMSYSLSLFFFSWIFLHFIMVSFIHKVMLPIWWMLENTEGTIKSRETGNTGHTRRRKTEQKHNTICVRYHYAQTNTDNVNKTRAILHWTGGKDEPNIVFYAKIVTDIYILQLHRIFSPHIYIDIFMILHHIHCIFITN